MSNIAIKAENISKYYRLGQINNGTLYADIQSWFARKFGEEDPHAKIGFNSSQSDKEGFWALKDINFEIKQGDRVGIIGLNGAGKSTLLKVISEITTPTTGNIYIKGRVASLLEVGTGFHPEMTGRENIYMNGAILGMKKAEITRQLDEIIDFAEIEKYIDTPVKRYSSGMYVRLAFAVVAHLQSEILIADEVLAVGDAMFQKKALGKMNDLSTEKGRTILFVSHQMSAVKSLCNEGIILDKGRIIYNGNINDAVSFYINSSNITTDKKYDFSKYSNEIFDLNSFYFSDADGNILTKNIFSNDEDFFVQIDFNYKKQDSAFCIGYTVYSEFGDCLYWSYPTDVAEKDWLKFSIGRNIIRSKFPKHFLNGGKYYLKVISGLHFIKWFIEPDKALQIKFEIVGGYSDSPMWNQKRLGFCAPILNWELIKY